MWIKLDLGGITLSKSCNKCNFETADRGVKQVPIKHSLQTPTLARAGK